MMLQKSLQYVDIIYFLLLKKHLLLLLMLKTIVQLNIYVEPFKLQIYIFCNIRYVYIQNANLTYVQNWNIT